MISNIDKFQKNIKIKFNNKSLLIKALTHKSSNTNYNNENLEFLRHEKLFTTNQVERKS